MDYNLLIIGTIGGFIIQLVKFLNPEEKFDFGKLSDYVPFIVNPIISGSVVFAYLYSGTISMNSVLALHIGISAPVILNAMRNIIPVKLNNNDNV